MDKKIITTIVFMLIVYHAVNQTVTITGADAICAGQSTVLHADVSGSGFGTTSYNFEIIDYEEHPDFSGGTAIDRSHKVNYSYHKFYL